MVAMYRIKPPFTNIPNLCTQIEGKTIALNQAFVNTVPASASAPERKVSVPVATQSDLKALYAQGCPCVEEFEEKLKADKE